MFDELPLEKELTLLMLTTEVAKAYNNLDRLDHCRHVLPTILSMRASRCSFRSGASPAVVEYQEQKFRRSAILLKRSCSSNSRFSTISTTR
jgi:hypothetical protein